MRFHKYVGIQHHQIKCHCHSRKGSVQFDVRGVGNGDGGALMK